MAFANTHRGARISPTKARLVIDLIRGKKVDQAMTTLMMSKKRAAVFISNALKAAIANAIELGELSTTQANELFVKEARVDSGPTIKRFQPKDRGRAHPIKKRTCHITVAVEPLPNKQK